MPTTGNDIGYIQWLWSALLIPLTWLYHRMNRTSQKTDETRIVLAERHYTKLEVDHLVDKAVKPVHDKLNDISSDVKYLVRRDQKSRKNDA
ncbi:hypothetical protein MNBD_ALPHA03-1281 [hydrothermal vent metagenome]|uniref:Uncharacterized protein n=1 Tax=hydrothermal vent metagenome TaxID=652676 RepID=A0A3B1B7S5_9ZZZZ